MKITRLSILVAIFFVTGCSTFISGRQQEMSFQSTPEGATVAVNGRILGKAPLTVQLDKKKDQTLTFSMDGYKTVTMPLTTTLNSWFWGNILIGGLFGSTTDNYTGAMNEYAPTQYMVNLVPENTSRLEIHTVQSQQDKVRVFVLLRYKNIVADIAKGGGDDLNSLLTLLGAPKDKQQVALLNIKQISESTTDATTFSEKVAHLKYQ